MTTVREPRLKPVAVIDLRPTLDGYSGDDDKDPNRPLWKCAAYCESIAAEWAAQHGISKSDAYTDLLKTDRAFQIVWRAATQIPTE
jgi:hypothetical protein